MGYVSLTKLEVLLKGKSYKIYYPIKNERNPALAEFTTLDITNKEYNKYFKDNDTLEYGSPYLSTNELNALEYSLANCYLDNKIENINMLEKYIDYIRSRKIYNSYLSLKCPYYDPNGDFNVIDKELNGYCKYYIIVDRKLYAFEASFGGTILEEDRYKIMDMVKEREVPNTLEELYLRLKDTNSRIDSLKNAIMRRESAIIIRNILRDRVYRHINFYSGEEFANKFNYDFEEIINSDIINKDANILKK